LIGAFNPFALRPPVSKRIIELIKTKRKKHYCYNYRH